MMSARQENRRLYNWALRLTEFDFEIKYCSGKGNSVANFLSFCYNKKEQCCAEDGQSASQKEGGGDVGMPS